MCVCACKVPPCPMAATASHIDHLQCIAISFYKFYISLQIPNTARTNILNIFYILTCITIIRVTII